MRNPRRIQTIIRSLAPPPLQFEAYLIRADIEAAFHPHTSEHAKAVKTPTYIQFNPMRFEQIPVLFKT